MIGRTSGASRFNIDKFSEVWRLRDMEKVVGKHGKRDDFVMDAFFYFELVQRFEYRVICLVLGFQLLREQGSFAVAGDEIFVFCGKFK